MVENGIHPKVYKEAKRQRLIHEIKVFARANRVVCKRSNIICGSINWPETAILFQILARQKINTIKENDLIYLNKPGSLEI